MAFFLYILSSVCGRSGKLRLCVLCVYSIVVFIGYVYSVSAQGIVGRVINAIYYQYYYYYYLISQSVPFHLNRFQTKENYRKQEHIIFVLFRYTLPVQTRSLQREKAVQLAIFNSDIQLSVYFVS